MTNALKVLDKIQGKGKKKVVNFSLDQKLVDKLIELRDKKMKIKQISPLVNELLWDWLREFEGELDK